MEAIEALLRPLGESGLSLWLRREPLAYPLVSAAHILGIGMIVGAIGTLDLRLLGAFRRAPLAVLAPPLVRVAACGVLLAIATGLLLFAVRPGAYLGNAAFLAKIGLVALAVVNALFLRFNPAWRGLLEGGAPSLSLRLAAGASLILWLLAVIAGRWIAFL